MPALAATEIPSNAPNVRIFTPEIRVSRPFDL
jgi:hypothetical protein